MRKATGIVRRVQELGRIVIPMELRRTMKIEEGDPLEIFTEEGGQIIFRKYEPGCMVCGNAENVVEFKGKSFCPECIRGLVRAGR